MSTETLAGNGIDGAMGTTLWLLDLDPESGLGSGFRDVVEPCGFAVVAVPAGLRFK